MLCYETQLLDLGIKLTSTCHPLMLALPSFLMCLMFIINIYPFISHIFVYKSLSPLSACPTILYIQPSEEEFLPYSLLMEFTELSLAGGLYSDGKRGGDGDGETGLPLKRKWNTEADDPSTVDLQLKHPLPSDWEQCLDLQSGRMYYVNRKTSRKSWMRPEEQKLDLDLNMSTGHNNGEKEDASSSTNMVALACSNCHLLVILCRSSPSCPNCKYVHSLASSSPKAKAPAPIGPSNWGL